MVTRVLRGLLGTGHVAAVGIACTWKPGYGTGTRVSRYLQAALDR